MSIGQKLKEVRELHNENQQDIANLLGTTQNYISRYESGKHDIPAYRLAILCEHWRVSADYILSLPEGLPHGHSKTKK